MRAVVVMPLSLLALAGALGGANARRAPAAVTGDNMCTTPHDDTAKWAPAMLQALSLKVPTAYKFSGSSGGRSSAYRAGNRVIGLMIGDAGVQVPQTFYYSIGGGEWRQRGNPIAGRRHVDGWGLL